MRGGGRGALWCVYDPQGNTTWPKMLGGSVGCRNDPLYLTPKHFNAKLCLRWVLLVLGAGVKEPIRPEKNTPNDTPPKFQAALGPKMLGGKVQRVISTANAPLKHFRPSRPLLGLKCLGVRYNGSFLQPTLPASILGHLVSRWGIPGDCGYSM